jgi:hypothetical protein
MIKVSVEEITERIQYAFDFIFLSNNVAYEFITSGEGDLDYTRTESATFNVADLLYEKGVTKHEITSGEFAGEFCFEINGKLDPIATIFYILSRYEEYGNSEMDEHGRYKFQNSYQYKFEVLEKAVVDRLSNKIITSIDPLFKSNTAVSIIPTFDIDNVYAYKLKKGVRKFGSQLKDILGRDKKRLNERNRVRKGEQDPYDTYDLIIDVAQGFPNTKVFWLSGGDSKYDRNVSISNKAHSELIARVHKACVIGLHPSYSSFNSVKIIAAEKLNLEKVINDTILHSRFHFLRFTVPDSYSALINSGILNDYSMGYAGHCGFRAGTAKPFLWFDLLNEQVTELTIYPFAYMDGTLNEYFGLTIDEAKQKISSLYKEISICGGNMIGIWHNETIGNYNHWKGWVEVLNYNLQLDE